MSIISKKNPPFGRLITAMVTPFDKEGKVNFSLAGELARFLIEEGSDGLVVCGTTGEAPTLSWKEQMQLLEAVREAVGENVHILAGTGSNSTKEAVDATCNAAAVGANGALVIVPYYNKPPQEGLEAHFRAVSTAAPELPLMLYNIPSRTGCDLKPTTVSKLMNCSNIVSYKAASGTTDEVTQLRLRCGERLSIYSGDDALTLPMLSVGAVGVVSVASHIVGRKIIEIIEAHISGNSSLAMILNERLQPFFKSLFTTTNPIPIKAALELNGWPVGKPRLPLVPLSAEMRDALSKSLLALRQT